MKAHYLASCYGKQQFITYEDAKAGAAVFGSTAKAYKCKYGEHYHRGRKPS